MCVGQLIGILKDVAQILFWIVAASIAFFSYRQAKKSIFQPAKNEVFKVQIESLQSLLGKLNWRSSVDAWRDSGLEASARISINGAFKAYAKDKFDADIVSEDEEKLISVGAILSVKATGFELVKGPADLSEHRESVDRRDFSWENFTWETFAISAEFKQVEDLIQHASNNPVLPLSIIAKVESLAEELHKSAVRAAEDLEKAVREFPRHYPTVESLHGANLTWASNMREERGQGLLEALKDLKSSIRSYLNSDKLLGEGS